MPRKIVNWYRYVEWIDKSGPGPPQKKKEPLYVHNFVKKLVKEEKLTRIMEIVKRVQEAYGVTGEPAHRRTHEAIERFPSLVYIPVVTEGQIGVLRQKREKRVCYHPKRDLDLKKKEPSTPQEAIEGAKKVNSTLKAEDYAEAMDRIYKESQQKQETSKTTENEEKAEVETKEKEDSTIVEPPIDKEELLRLTKNYDALQDDYDNVVAYLKESHKRLIDIRTNTLRRRESKTMKEITSICGFIGSKLRELQDSED